MAFSQEDFYYDNAPKDMTLRQKLVAFLLPWLVLAGFAFGLYLTADYILEALVRLSEPVSELMPK